MTSTTPIRGIRKPAGGDPPNLPIIAGNVADDTETAMNQLGLRQVVVFTTSGTFTKATYPWLNYVRVRVLGGGGGSAGTPATAAGQIVNSGGGGAGGYAEKVIPVASLAASETVTVGAAGAAGTNAPGAGGAGGTSSFGAFASAAGGSGSATQSVAGSPNSGPYGGGGAGGAGSSGDLNLTGELGGDGFLAYTSGMGGHGGRGYLYGTRANPNTAATGYGSGGGGRCANPSTAAQVGLAGAAGIVVVELYG